MSTKKGPALNPASKNFVPAAGAWGKKPSEAIRKAPPPAPAPSAQSSSAGAGRHSHRGGGGGGSGGAWSGGRGVNHNHGGGRGGRARGGGGAGGPGAGGGGGGNRGQRHDHKHHRPPAPATPSTTTALNNSVKLCQPGEGITPEQKAVTRITVDIFLQLRLQFLAPPSKGWNPPEAAHWVSDTREEEIASFVQQPRTTGDVTVVHNNNNGNNNRPPNNNRRTSKDTAPPLEDCAPLQINDETRWKARIFDPNGLNEKKEDDEEDDKEVLKKALLILNKLSWTKFDKLSEEFVATGIGRNPACLQGAIGLLVEKAQSEPHFASMYAQLCFQMAHDHVGGKKVFKKLLLTRCQEEFEEDIALKVEKAVAGIEDKEEQQYHAQLVKKNYLGHMRFIGELYKGDMIKIEVMLFCLDRLLTDAANNEENVECFAKLMSTVGESLAQQSQALRDAGKPSSAEGWAACWKTVETLAGPAEGPTVSNRMKFMLQDLLELRNNGWVKRRKEETAKTLAQIHKEVAKEERARKNPSKPAAMTYRRAHSTGDVRILDRQSVTDDDGFTQVVRSTSGVALHRSVSDAGVAAFKKPVGGVRRSVSFVAPKPPPKPSLEEYPSLDECGEKSKKILKEFFMVGDMDDIILSIDEIVGVGHAGSVERGAMLVEKGTLTVLEMKDTEVKKFLAVLARCLKDKKIEKHSVMIGLNIPLECLSDIAIDAPLAISHMVTIVAELIKCEVLTLDLLLEAPEYFRTDGNAAQFCAKVVLLKKADGEVTDADIGIIEMLMTDDDKADHATARDLLASV